MVLCSTGGVGIGVFFYVCMSCYGVFLPQHGLCLLVFICAYFLGSHDVVPCASPFCSHFPTFMSCCRMCVFAPTSPSTPFVVDAG